MVVDWECRGKEARQNGRDTEINCGTAEELVAMRQAVSGAVACRIDNVPYLRGEQLRRAVDFGADEIWLPMVRTLAEVEECLELLPAHCRLGVLAETTDALGLADVLNELPLSRVYVGLNDLWICSGRRHLFSALIDGALDEFRSRFKGVLGVGGITRPAGGSPVPCSLLLGEMSRLDCAFGVARRTFRRDTGISDLRVAILEIQLAMRHLDARTSSQIQIDRDRLESCVRTLEASTVLDVSHTLR